MKLLKFVSVVILILDISIKIGLCDDSNDFGDINDFDKLKDLKRLFFGDGRMGTFMDSKKDPVFYHQPEQIHISYGENLSSIVVTWSTKHATGESIVEYGINGLIKKAYGEEKLFIDGGVQKRSQYIHRVTLQKLRPNELYLYHCGSDLGWSPEFWFKTPRTDPDWSPHLAIYGDLGNINPQSLPRLQEETQRNMYDAILHVGDFAYDMDFENGEVGDEFMRQLTPIAAYVPYMTVPGNHEEKYNFSHYRSRFSMPGGTESIMYSFNLGPAHFIGFSTEVYYFLGYGIKQLVMQYEWLEKDLEEANKPENRKKHPWIITYGHRPMYCSNSDRDDCTYHSTLVRVGLPILKCDAFCINQQNSASVLSNVRSSKNRGRIKWQKRKRSILRFNYMSSLFPTKTTSMSAFLPEIPFPTTAFPPRSSYLPWMPRITCTMFGLEKLFYDYGVDLQIYAHEHSYERLWPVYDNNIYNGSFDEPYKNPRAPVHIVTGSAGCRENTDEFIPNPQKWSAFRSSDYGYTRLKIHNGTHIYLEQVSDDKGGQIIDSFWVIKDVHGPYNATQP